MTPREIVRSHALTYLAGHAALFACLLYSLNAANMRAARLFACMLAFFGPWCLIVSYRTAIRAWRNMPPDDLRDGAMPTLILILLFGGIYLFL